MNVILCPVCNHPILPGEPRISWFNQDFNNNTTDRGAIHLKHLTGGVTNGS